MALDDVGNIKSLAIPRWVKIFIGAILLTAISSDIWIALTAASNSSRKEWFPAAVQLFGSLVPIVIVVLLLALSHSGTDTLARRTSQVLLRLIPSSIPFAATPVPAFANPHDLRLHHRYRGNTQVQVAYHPGDFYVRYRITFPDVWTPEKNEIRRLCFLVIDLKIYQANMHLCVPKRRLYSYCVENGRQLKDIGEVFREAFRHTLAGAEAAGCRINQSVTEFELGGEPLCCLVVIRPLSPEFLNEPAEQLYIAQDLVAMLRGFWRERTDWFPEVFDEKNRPSANPAGIPKEAPISLVNRGAAG